MANNIKTQTNSEAEPIISLKSVSKWYEDFQALKNNFYNYRVGGKGTKYIQ